MKKLSKASKPATTLEVTAADKKAAQALIKMVSLQHMMLTSSETELDAEFLPDDRQPMSLITKLEGTTATRNGDNGEVLFCGLRLLALAGDENRDRPAVRVFAEYGLIYEIAGEFEATEVALNEFARHQALFNVWPFFREFVQSSILRMGLPGAFLPLRHLPLKPAKESSL